MLCCEGCPSTYHRMCLRPRPAQKWLDLFEEWYCPSCQPRFFHVPLRRIDTKEKLDMSQEPLLENLNTFLTNNPDLERDPNPIYHPKRVR